MSTVKVAEERMIPMRLLGNGFWVNNQQLEDIKKWANMMTMDEYQDAARTTAMYRGIGTFDGVVYNVLKLAGESGEIADKVGKIFGKGEVPNQDQILDLNKELGDVLWHLAMAARDLGLCLDDVASSNLAKLKSRQERGVIVGDGDNR